MLWCGRVDCLPSVGSDDELLISNCGSRDSSDLCWDPLEFPEFMSSSREKNGDPQDG